VVKFSYLIKKGVLFMAEKRNVVKIKCSKCNNWFKSPIYFGNIESLDSCTLIGNTVSCPFCGQFVPCNKENMRFVSADKGSGFLGTDTSR